MPQLMFLAGCLFAVGALFVTTYRRPLALTSSMKPRPDSAKPPVKAGIPVEALAGVEREPPLLPAVPSTADAADASEATTGEAFLIEAMVSAGPRKAASAYEAGGEATELCEDATGVLSLTNGRQIWWLCDGTSQGDHLPPVGDTAGLSTRMLARDLGDCFVKWGVKGGESEPANEVLSRLEALWQWRLETYLSEVERLGVRSQLDDVCAINADGSRSLKWSTTFVGGLVQSGGGPASLHLFQAGDSGAVVVSRNAESRQAHAVLPTPERVIVQANILEDRVSISVHAPTRGLKRQMFNGIVGFVAMSDGLIRSDLESFLYRIEKLAAEYPMSRLREGLVSRNDRSFDDKSLIVGRFIKV